MTNDKGKWSVVTPGSAEVQKSYEDLLVTCTNASSTGTGSFQSRNNNNVWGNLLIGGGIGYVIDSSSGAGFNYPEAVTIVLIPPCPKVTAP
jgi:phosphoketolase